MREYNEMTPAELNLYIREYADRLKLEQENALILTYLGAYWQRVERMPDLEKLLAMKPKPKQPQSDEAMFAEIQRINDRFNKEG